jgi:hypothetical protein
MSCSNVKYFTKIDYSKLDSELQCKAIGADNLVNIKCPKNINDNDTYLQAYIVNTNNPSINILCQIGGYCQQNTNIINMSVISGTDEKSRIFASKIKIDEKGDYYIDKDFPLISPTDGTQIYLQNIDNAPNVNISSLCLPLDSKTTSE